MVNWTETGDVALTHPKAKELLVGGTKESRKEKRKEEEGHKEREETRRL